MRLSPFWTVAALLIILVEGIAVSSGGDATWDMRNYHLYAPFALLHKPFGVDIAPAHMQGFFSPTLDLIYYALATSIPFVPLLNAVLAIPQSVAAVLGFALSWRLVRPRGWAEVAALGLLAGIAATGAASISTIATSMSEILPVALVLGAWLVLVQRDLPALPPPGRLFAAGLLAGAACGLKLTLVCAAVALVVVVVLLPRRRWSDVVVRPVVFGCGIGVGAVALSGYWWALEWVRFGNPLFPTMNQIFHSPMAVPDSFVDRTFLPRSLREAFAAPWSWTLSLSRATSESRLRDPRFALALVAAAVALINAGVSRPRWRPWPIVLLPVWFILTFVLWRVQFSIYRYLSVLELCIGAVAALAAFPIARRLGRPWLLPGGAAVCAAAVAFITVYPQFYRSPVGDPTFTVSLGPVRPDSMVLLLDNEPMGYLAAFADPRARFVATNDYFMSLDGSNPMQALVEHAIAGHSGPLLGLDSPLKDDGRAAATLAHYGLTRGACRPVVSNVSPEQLRICELARGQSG